MADIVKKDVSDKNKKTTGRPNPEKEDGYLRPSRF